MSLRVGGKMFYTLGREWIGREWLGGRIGGERGGERNGESVGGRVGDERLSGDAPGID